MDLLTFLHSIGSVSSKYGATTSGRQADREVQPEARYSTCLMLLLYHQALTCSSYCPSFRRGIARDQRQICSSAINVSAADDRAISTSPVHSTAAAVSIYILLSIVAARSITTCPLTAAVTITASATECSRSHGRPVGEATA